MRFGFFFWPYTPDYTTRMARLGEEYGFDMVGIADTPGNAMDAWVAMTLAAAATSRIRLATCVTNLVSRHPSITASAAASVDAASEGRTILGIGAGHSGVTNVGGAPTGARALREGVAFLRTVLGGGPAVRELRATYTTRQREMDPTLVKRLGLFDYLRARLAIAGTPEDCIEQVRGAEAAGATQLMFTVSLAADPEGTVELFGREVLPALSR